MRVLLGDSLNWNVIWEEATDNAIMHVDISREGLYPKMFAQLFL